MKNLGHVCVLETVCYEESTWPLSVDGSYLPPSAGEPHLVQVCKGRIIQYSSLLLESEFVLVDFLE